MSRPWICCCGEANNEGTAPERCPVCQHFRCSACGTQSRNLFEALSYYSAAEPRHVPSLSLNSAISHPSVNNAQPSHHGSYTYSNRRGNSSAPGRSYFRPDMTGWWECSECKSINNPELAPSLCSICGHLKCASCTVYQR